MKLSVQGTGKNYMNHFLTDEECLVAEDLGEYYRIQPDDRDLNYSKYFSEGVKPANGLKQYNSHNTYRLSKEELEEDGS